MHPSARAVLRTFAAAVLLCDLTAGHAAPAPELDLRIDRAETLEFRVPAGQSPPELPGLHVSPIPAGAGGGLQAALPVPADPAAANVLRERLERLQAAGQIADLQPTPCRKFLPEQAGQAPPGDPPPTPPARTAQIIAGTAQGASGGALGPAAVLASGAPPDPPGADGSGRLDWKMGVDDRGPSLGFPNVDGRFYAEVAGAGPYRVQLAPVCNCAITAPVTATTTTTVPVNTVAVSTDDGGASSAPDDALDDVCYCGRDMGAALAAAIERLSPRLRDLPDSEKGAFDGPLFMNRNADAFDAPPAPLYKPGVDPATVSDREAALLCPSGHCNSVEMRQPTFWLAGRCLPRHMSNDILAAFVAAGVEVPFVVLQHGANVRELVNNHGLEGTASIAAYQAGYALHEASEEAGPLDQAQVEKIVGDVLESSLFGYFHSYTWILDDYPTLAHCQKCPVDTPGAYGGKDFTRDAWTLEDGSKVGEDLDGSAE